MSRGGDLLRLQDLDTLVAHDTVRLRDVEAEIENDPELEQRRVGARRARRARQAAETAVAAAETEADVLRQRARLLDRHLYDGSVGNPQELLGMQEELGALRGRIDSGDDALLDLMQRAEAATAAERDANAAIVEHEQVRADRSGELLEVAAALRAALAQHEHDRTTVVAGLEGSDVALYDRLRRRLQPAVVRVVGDSCGGCHVPFANSELRRVRTAVEPAQCPGCDRVVVS